MKNPTSNLSSAPRATWRRILTLLKNADILYPGDEAEVKAYEAKSKKVVSLRGTGDKDGQKEVKKLVESYITTVKEECEKEIEGKDQVIFIGIANFVATINGENVCVIVEGVDGLQDISCSWGYKMNTMARTDMVLNGLLEKFALEKTPRYARGLAEPMEFKIGNFEIGELLRKWRRPKVKYIVYTDHESLSDDKIAVREYAKKLSPRANITVLAYARTGAAPLEDLIMSDRNNDGFKGLAIYLSIETRFESMDEKFYAYIYITEKHTAACRRISSSRGFEIPEPKYTKAKAEGTEACLINHYLGEYKTNRQKIVREALNNKFSDMDSRGNTVLQRLLKLRE